MELHMVIEQTFTDTTCNNAIRFCFAIQFSHVMSVAVITSTDITCELSVTLSDNNFFY